jgi:flagellum-specific ATP synthase
MVAKAIRQIMTTYDDVIDLVHVGAYQPGVSRETDMALELYPRVSQFLQQRLGEPSSLADTKATMSRIAQQWTSVSDNRPTNENLVQQIAK